MTNGSGKNAPLPYLSVPGALITSVFLLALSAAGALFPILALPLCAVSGALFAALLLLHRALLSVIAPLLCAALAAVLTNGIAVPLAFLFLPIGFSAAFAVFVKMNRVRALTVSSCACAFVGAVSFLASIFACGDTPRTFLVSLRESAAAFLTSLTVLTENGIRMPILTKESAAAILSHITVLLPAIGICTLFLISYAATALLWKILRYLGADTDFLPDGWKFVPGIPAAAIYLFTQPITFLCASLPSAQPLYFGFYNVSLVFRFPLALFGIAACISLFCRKSALGGVGKAALAAMILMLFASGFYWFMTAAALYGIYLIFRTGRSDPASV